MATGIAGGLAHHQLGGAGQLVDDGDLGDLQLPAERVGGAAQVDDRRRCRRSRWPRRSAPRRHARPNVSDTITPRRRRPGRAGRRGCAGPSGRESSGSSAAQPSLDVGQVDAGVGADEPVPGLADDQVAAAAQRCAPTRPRRAPCAPSGSSGSTATSLPSAFDTIFWVTTTTSPSASSAAAATMSAARSSPGRTSPMPVDADQLDAGAIAHEPIPSSTTRAQRGGLGRSRHDRRRHDAAHARGLDGAGRVGVGLVDDERGGQLGVEPGHADHRRLVAQLGQHPVGRALERRAGDDRRHGHHVGRGARRPRRARRARRAAGRSTRSGSTGAITTRSAVGDRVEHAGRRSGVARRRRSAPR